MGAMCHLCRRQRKSSCFVLRMLLFLVCRRGKSWAERCKGNSPGLGKGRTRSDRKGPSRQKEETTDTVLLDVGKRLLDGGASVVISEVGTPYCR